MNKINLEIPIQHDDYTRYICNHFDYPIKETVSVEIPFNIILPEKWNIGVIYGPSGSGKSTILKTFGEVVVPYYDNKPIVSQFSNLTPNEVIELFSSVGLNNVHTWLKPYHVLSVGEKSRVDLAWHLYQNKDIILIDEFTSTVNRECAKSICLSLKKYINKTNKKIILSTCHEDILEWLQPNWIYNTFSQSMVDPTVFLQQPKKSKLTIQRCEKSLWKYFSYYHYMTDSHQIASKCYLLYLDNHIIGWCSIIHFPHSTWKNAWRVHRLVILPDYQGRGIGLFIINLFGQIISNYNVSFFNRTSHIGFVKSLTNNYNNWKCLGDSIYDSHGKSSKVMGKKWKLKKDKKAWSFKYIGPKTDNPELLKLW